MRVAPILPVRDVRAALAHYAALGFATRAYEESDDAGPFYGFLERDGAQAHLARVAELDPLTNTSAVYLYVDDADALHAAWTAAGVGGRFVAPSDTDYGLREMAHIDPDGNLWRVGSPIPRR
jgi:uncharacterized glyoxalase superfamily protein PhnB